MLRVLALDSTLWAEDSSVPLASSGPSLAQGKGGPGRRQEAGEATDREDPGFLQGLCGGPAWISYCIRVGRQSGFFSWSVKCMALATTLVWSMIRMEGVTPRAWHYPGQGVEGRAMCCGQQGPRARLRWGIGPLMALTVDQS